MNLRRLENIGEDFEVAKRSFVAEEETKKAPLLPVVNPDTKEQVERAIAEHPIKWFIEKNSSDESKRGGEIVIIEHSRM